MCGLVGAFKAQNAHFQKIGHFMWQGLYMSALRGMGGTGCGIVFDDFDTEYSKTHASAVNFLGTAEWEWIDKNLFKSRAVIGHTRSATTGSVKAVNSHPFRFKNADSEVMMIHNGHIRNHLALTPAGFNHDVDSAHVAHSLLHRGAIPTLELLEGAYTLIWYDKKKQTMNLARNEERELFYAQNKAKTTFYFASEIDFLCSLLRRNGIEHEDSFYTLNTHTLYEFDLNKAILTPKETQYEEKKAPPVRSFPNYQSGSGGQYGEKSDSWKDYTKNFPGVGDHIWCRVSENADTALTLYKEIDGTTCTEATAYGHVYGVRTQDPGSIVRVNGIPYNYWHSDLHKIKNMIPMKITKVDRTGKNKHTNATFVYYEGTICHDECAADIRQENARLNRVRLDEKRREDDKKRDQITDAAIAAGRALPVVQTSPTDTMGAQRGIRPGIVGVDVGSSDSGATDTDSTGLKLGVGGLEEKEPFIVSPSWVRGPKGQRWTIREWKECAQQGCYFCQGHFDIQVDEGKVEFWEHPLNPEDHGHLDIEYQMICPTCMSEPHKAEAIVAA